MSLKCIPRGSGASSGTGRDFLVRQSQAVVARLEAMVGTIPVPFASEMQPPAGDELDELQALVIRLEALATAGGA